MTIDRHPDPHCPYCHGSGVITLSAPFLDRIDESTKPCRCVRLPESQEVEEDAAPVGAMDEE